MPNPLDDEINRAAKLYELFRHTDQEATMWQRLEEVVRRAMKLGPLDLDRTPFTR